MKQALREFVWQRAQAICEYCRMPQQFVEDLRHQVDLFNPRTDDWSQHFRWDGAMLPGLTPVGRATVRLLKINAYDRVDLRRSLLEEGVFPPARS